MSIFCAKTVGNNLCTVSTAYNLLLCGWYFIGWFKDKTLEKIFKEVKKVLPHWELQIVPEINTERRFY